VDFTATSARDILKRGDETQVVVRVANKSAVPVSNLRISLISPDFTLQNPVKIPSLPAFGSQMRQVRIKALDSAPFATLHPVLVSDFDWGSKPLFHSNRSLALNLQVVHQYEDEAKGLPGGSAALLYFILPIIPAFLAYDLVDGARQGQGLRIPKFDSAYIAPAFLIAILVEYLLVLNARGGSFDFADPKHVLGALAVSTVAGALIPGTRIIHHAIRMRDAFRDSDGLSVYLRKALNQCPNGSAQWVQGTGNWDHFEGLLFTQPDDKPVLGARLQVSPAKNNPGTVAALKGCFNDDGDLIDPERLRSVVVEGNASLDLLEQVQEAGEPRAQAAITRGLAGFTHQNPEAKRIVELVV